MLVLLTVTRDQQLQRVPATDFCMSICIVIIIYYYYHYHYYHYYKPYSMYIYTIKKHNVQIKSKERKENKIKISRKITLPIDKKSVIALV